MGNRAVLAFGPDAPDTIGVYLHWNGGRASVEGMLAAAKDLGIRGPGTDCYAQARFCQIVGNWFGGGLSLGVDTLARSDCDNGDNGVYFLGPNWEILERKFKPAEEEVDPVRTKAVRTEIVAKSATFYPLDERGF